MKAILHTKYGPTEVLELLADQTSRFQTEDCRGDCMIRNDQELQVTQERIARFQRWLADLR
jgi:hypothetical protein